LNPRKAPTGKFPVVYENLVSGSLLGHLLEGISGSTIADKTSFLQGALHSQIFPQNVLIWDDPFLERGLGSHPFDGEGLGVRKLPVVENGRLTTWLLNLRAARQLGLPPTGHGTVAVGSPPGIACSNFYMSPGSETLEQLLAPITSGFFVTDLMGHTVNGLTGDYSLGASGFWIESGSLAYPVQGLTIAGNLRDMFKNCTPADDLQFRSGVDAPTLRIDSMSVAGGAV
jgi:PmbA protein